MVQLSQSQDDETGDGTTGNLCCHVLKFNKKTFFSHSTRLSVSIIFFISVHHAGTIDLNNIKGRKKMNVGCSKMKIKGDKS